MGNVIVIQELRAKIVQNFRKLNVVKIVWNVSIKFPVKNARKLIFFMKENVVKQDVKQENDLM